MPIVHAHADEGVVGVEAVRRHAFIEGKLLLAIFADNTGRRCRAAVKFLPVSEGTPGNAHGGAVISG